MWVMTKKIKGREYLYLYKTVWRDGRPKSQYVKYLGGKNRYSEDLLKNIIQSEEKISQLRGE